MTMADILSILLLLCLVVSGLYHLFPLFCVREFFSRERSSATGPQKVSVSIIKPLKRIDHELKENLATFYNQDYPDYKVLLGLSEQTQGAHDGRDCSRLLRSPLPCRNQLDKSRCQQESIQS